MSEALSAANKNLMAVLKFTPEDLELNKQGKLSQTQIQNMEQKMDEGIGKTKKILTAVVIISIIMMANQMLEKGNLQQNLLKTVAYFVATMIIYYFGTQWFVKYTTQKNKELISTNPKIECLSGKVELVSQTYGGQVAAIANISGQDSIRNFNTIKIAGEKIYVEQETISTFEDGKEYNIYTIKFPTSPYSKIVTHMIVAAERIN